MNRFLFSYSNFFILFLLWQTNAYSQISSKLNNNAAVRELEDGDVGKAEKLMENALETDAADPVILYNWATMNLHSVLKSQEKEKSPDAQNAPQKKDLNEEQKKKVESSHAEYEKFLKAEKLPSFLSRKELLYQNAIALELLGNTKEALMNYYQSLHADANHVDNVDLRKLTEKTQINISRLLAKSQSSGQGQGEGSGGGGEGNQQEDSKGQGKDGDKGKNSSNDSKGQGRSPLQPEFSGTDINSTQAQQILNSVSNQDRQVQQRRGQQQSKQNMQNGEEGDISPRENAKPW